MSEIENVINDDVASIDISMSEIEAIANTNKMRVEDDDISIREESQHSYTKSSESPKFSNKQVSESVMSYKSSKNSSVSEDTDYVARVRKENKNIKTMREKSFLLFQIKKANPNGEYGENFMSANDLLDDIRAEYNRITHEKDLNRNVDMLKGVLSLGVKGAEILNEKFNPIGLDLEGWSESMEYSLGQHQYDEVLAELSEKYKSVATVSPEFKLIFMIVGSAVTFSVTKGLFKQAEQKQEIRRPPVAQPRQQRQPVRQPMAQPQRPQQVPVGQSQSKLVDPESLFDEHELNTIMAKMNEEKKVEQNASSSSGSSSTGRVKSRRPPRMSVIDAFTQ